jgi:hypothetical protein
MVNIRLLGIHKLTVNVFLCPSRLNVPIPFKEYFFLAVCQNSKISNLSVESFPLGVKLKQENGNHMGDNLGILLIPVFHQENQI